MAAGLNAYQLIPERVSFCRPFKSSDVSLPMNCMLIFAPIDELRPMSNMKGFYA